MGKTLTTQAAFMAGFYGETPMENTYEYNCPWKLNKDSFLFKRISYIANVTGVSIDNIIDLIIYAGLSEHMDKNLKCVENKFTV
jgi:hypothetical protein